jgi:hypothetical protein
MGDPNTPEGKAQLVRQSPLTHAAKIRTPLLVAQGANDPRVNKAESDQIVIALRDRNYPVEYLVAPDEGHGFARPVNQMAMIAAAEKFLAKHLGGRYQESMPAAVAARLTELTVDPKTVTLAKKTNGNGSPTGTLDGKWSFVVDGPSGQIPLSVELKQSGTDFSGTMASDVGSGVFEKGKIEGTSVTALLRADIQGQPTEVQVEAKLEGEKLSGTLNVPGLGIFSFSAARAN